MLNRFAAISGDMKKAGSTIFALVGAQICIFAIAPGAALAQNSARDSALAANASASPPANPTDEPAPANNEFNPEESAILGNALTLDPATLNNLAPVKTLRLPSLSTSQNPDISRTTKSDGTSTATLKQPLPIDWDAKVGA